MALETITRKVLSYCEIPEEITEDHYVSQAEPDTYMEFHFDDNLEIEDDELTAWIRLNYPELVDEEAFLIHIDY